MTKELFYEYALEKAKGEFGSDYTIKAEIIPHSDMPYFGLVINKDGGDPAPIVNLDLLYKVSRQGETAEETLDNAFRYFKSLKPLDVDVSMLDDYRNVKQKLFIKVTNAVQSREMLEKVPHRNVCDLAITYHVLISNVRGEIRSCMVTNEWMGRFGIGEEQLHEDAVTGSMAQFPPTIRSLASTIGADDPGDDGLYVVSNRAFTFGAAALFYPDMLDTVKKKVGSNYYVLPSSKHEMLVMKKKKGSDPNEYAKMVREINRTQVAPEDRLSDHVYYCHVKKGERLIDIVA